MADSDPVPVPVPSSLSPNNRVKNKDPPGLPRLQPNARQQTRRLQRPCARGEPGPSEKTARTPGCLGTWPWCCQATYFWTEVANLDFQLHHLVVNCEQLHPTKQEVAAKPMAPWGTTVQTLVFVQHSEDA